VLLSYVADKLKVVLYWESMSNVTYYHGFSVLLSCAECFHGTTPVFCVLWFIVVLFKFNLEVVRSCQRVPQCRVRFLCEGLAS